MGLEDSVLRGVYAYGFEAPSRVQKSAIPTIKRGEDAIIQGACGSGTSCGVAVGIIHVVAASGTTRGGSTAIVLVPGRELALQLQQAFVALGDYVGLQVALAIGGTPVRQCMKGFGRGVHVTVGTPGRVLDMMKREALKPQHTRMLVLDEGNRMLSSSLKEAIYDVFQHLPSDVQVVLSGSYMSPEVVDMTKKFLREPVHVPCPTSDLLPEGIRHHVVFDVPEEYKLDTLCDLFDTLASTQVIVFVNTTRKVDWLYSEMVGRDFTVASLHDSLPQEERQLIMREFRAGSSRVLISTDLLAYGIDVQQVGIVVNYDQPNSPEIYMHRAARSGRFGRKGVVISLLTKNEEVWHAEACKVLGIESSMLPATLEL